VHFTYGTNRFWARWHPMALEATPPIRPMSYVTFDPGNSRYPDTQGGPNETIPPEGNQRGRWILQRKSEKLMLDWILYVGGNGYGWCNCLVRSTARRNVSVHRTTTNAHTNENISCVGVIYSFSWETVRTNTASCIFLFEPPAGLDPWRGLPKEVQQKQTKMMLAWTYRWAWPRGE